MHMYGPCSSMHPSIAHECDLTRAAMYGICTTRRKERLAARKAKQGGVETAAEVGKSSAAAPAKEKNVSKQDELLNSR